MHSVKITASIAVLLGIIIIAGLYTTSALASTSERLDGYIAKMEDSAKAGRWEDTKKELNAFRKDWEKTETGWAMLLDHIEIDNIDSTISRMTKFIETQDTPSALAEIATLRQFIKHIPEKESFTLKNVF